MISQLKPANVKVLSLTTIATPHRGSSFADVMFSWIGPTNIPKLYTMLEFFGFETGAFSQLTQSYMSQTFNPKTPDREGISYYSYGANVNPRFWSMFRQSHRIIQKLEGENDGLVSVESAKWGTYKGTLKDVSHLDMINWTNRLRWFLWELTGNKRNFNAIAFYLDIADMLAKEGH
ncbi:alpha/beta-hydrolase [Aureobasidium pullulans]|nr:alpha/beta-hydrolase [Aureobasidium pullulans]